MAQIDLGFSIGAKKKKKKLRNRNFQQLLILQERENLGMHFIGHILYEFSTMTFLLLGLYAGQKLLPLRGHLISIIAKY